MGDAIKKIIQLEKKAKEYGFYWPDYKSVMKQIYNECDEVNEVLVNSFSKEMLAEEIGDLLHAVFSLCIFCNLEPQEVLMKSVCKFEKRFDLTKKFALEEGHLNLHDQNIEEMMKYWNKAKLASKGD